MTREYIIQQLLEYKILGKNLKATKNAESRLMNNPHIQKLLVITTSYLDSDATIYERLMNIRLGITVLQRCENCNASLSGRIYLSQRRYHRFCHEKCRHGFVTEKRVKAFLADDSKLAKCIAKNSIETQKKRGTLNSRIKQSLETKRSNGQCIALDQVSEYDQYRSKVYAITKKQPLHLLPNIEKRGPIQNGGWHIDHKFSIRQGFLQNINPEIIGNFSNLEMIPGSLNTKKQDKCSISLTELIELIETKNLQN